MKPRLLRICLALLCIITTATALGIYRQATQRQSPGEQASGTFLVTTNQTLIQLTTPDQLRGRVMGVYMLNQGLLPLGSLLAGILADLLGAPKTVGIMGTLVALLALVFASQARTLRAS